MYFISIHESLPSLCFRDCFFWPVEDYWGWDVLFMEKCWLDSIHKRFMYAAKYLGGKKVIPLLKAGEKEGEIWCISQLWEKRNVK